MSEESSFSKGAGATFGVVFALFVLFVLVPCATCGGCALLGTIGSADNAPSTYEIDAGE